MQKKKKVNNKENLKSVKRSPLGAIPIFNYTEQIRIPTYSSTDLKSMIRSIDMRKPSTTNPYKKTISRKSTSKSVKQNPSYQPPKLRTIMKQFKELKLLHQNQRSKSKSPVSCKSRSLEKIFPKKLSYKTLRTNPTSEVNLALKLQKTMKKLNQTDFFKQDDSLIPIKSSSDLISDRNVGTILRTENDETINMHELRQFCSTGSICHKKNSNLAFKSYDSFKQIMAAVKIQRAWRRYRTQKLIERYVFLFHHQREPDFNASDLFSNQIQSQHIESFSEHENLQPEVHEKVDIEINSDNFYPEKLERNKVRHISNLEEQLQSGSQDYEEVVKKMKIEELQKWNQIIKIISGSKSENPQQLQKLLAKLAEQSQLNKKELEEKTNNILENSGKKKVTKEREKIKSGSKEQSNSKQIIRNAHIKNKSSSELSQGMEEYDSKKYIDYLDGDIFVAEDIQQSSVKNVQNAIKSSKISKRKQQLLLEELNIKGFPVKLGQSSHYRSQSLKGLDFQLDKQELRPSGRQGLNKSTSQKTLKRTLWNLYDSSFDQIDQQINLELLTRQFLQGTDPSMQNLDVLYSQDKLRTKLAELNKMKNNHMLGDDEDSVQDEIYQRDSDDDEFEPTNSLKRSDPIFQIHQRSVQEEIRIEEPEESPKMKVQLVEASIKSDSEDEVINEEENQKAETIATIIMNNLILQVLKEIAKSDAMSNTFKTYSLSLKPKVRKATGGKKKKGFPTNKAEVQLFLDGLIKYLKKQEKAVFNNLLVATGPSALQMLRYMHQFGQQESEQQNQEDQSNVMVVPNRIFDTFWQVKQKAIIIEIPETFDQTNSIIFKHQFQCLKSFNKIFYRSLFDTFNECLDCQRNFGQYGRPFPWKKAPYFEHKKSQQQIQLHISNAKKRMIEISTTYCGLIIQKEEMMSISQEYIQQVHQDRLSRMLASDLLEAEDRWVFYDDEETEILVQVSSAIYTEILIEIIQQIYEFI